MADVGSQLLDGMARAFPKWDPSTRPSHSSGISVMGTFRGTPESSGFCFAPMFGTDWTPVVVRFSNSKGQTEPDQVPDVRGMAVKFLLGTDDQPDHADLICISTPMFVVDTPQDLLDFEDASIPRPVKRRGWWKTLTSMLQLIEYPPQDLTQPSADDAIMGWSQRYGKARPFLQTVSGFSWTWNQDVSRLVHARPPASYARITYSAVHAFVVEGPSAVTGAPPVRRTVRFTFEPAAGVRENHDTAIADDYLHSEIADRLERGPCRFNLRMQVSDPWDDVTDPTKLWPSNRKRILMGTLELTHLVEDQRGPFGEQIGFNPAHTPPSMTPVHDEVFKARVGVYEESQRRRGAVTCPFSSPMSQSGDSS